MAERPRVRWLDAADYLPVYQSMQQFTQQRHDRTRDELWLVQHEPVFTQGLNGRPEHILDSGQIPVIPVDRGGQVTYHGPGQVVMYTLVDIGRRKLGVKDLVSLLEQAVIDLLAEHGQLGGRRDGAPGIYVNDAKVASLGLRIRKGRAYHGLSLNVDMDLAPFSRINPCGYRDLAVTQLRDLGIMLAPNEVGETLAKLFVRHLEQNTTAMADSKELIAIEETLPESLYVGH